MKQLDARNFCSDSSTSFDVMPVSYASGCVGQRIAVVQSVNDSTRTKILFNEADLFDTDNYHDTIVNPTRFTFPYTGIYFLSAIVFWAANATGSRHATWERSSAPGTGIPGQFAILTNPITANTQCTVEAFAVSFTAGEYAELTVYQTSGAGLNCQAYAQVFLWKY